MRMVGFDAMMERTRKLESHLARPSLYAEKRAEYTTQAALIAREVLLLQRPKEILEDKWKAKVDVVVARVTSDLLAGSNGIIFSVSEPAGDVSGGLADKDERPSSQVMSYDDIKEWIKAGQRGEPGAKRITAADEKLMAEAGGGEAGYNAVASIVMKAYYSRSPKSNYARLRAAVQRYMLGSRKAESATLLEAVAAAWRSHFSVVIPNDLKAFASRVCREF